MLTGTKLNEETKETSTFWNQGETTEQKKSDSWSFKGKAKEWKKNRICRPVLLTVADLEEIRSWCQNVKQYIVSFFFKERFAITATTTI